MNSVDVMKRCVETDLSSEANLEEIFQQYSASNPGLTVEELLEPIVKFHSQVSSSITVEKVAIFIQFVTDKYGTH